MDSLYSPSPDQDYVVAPDGSSQGTAPNSNMQREFEEVCKCLVSDGTDTWCPAPRPIGLDQSDLRGTYPELVDENTKDSSSSTYRISATV
jgi:hypothetical protein